MPPFSPRSYLGYPHSRAALMRMLGTESVWTIDLAVLLRHATGDGGSLRFLLCTTTLGAEDSYAQEAFYKQEFEVDALRINSLFRSASSLGVNYMQRSLMPDELARLICTGRVVIIMLLDLRVVRKAHLKHSFLGRAAGFGGYTGHYVVVCGYDPATARYTYMDPAQNSSKSALCFIHRGRGVHAFNLMFVLGCPPLCAPTLLLSQCRWSSMRATSITHASPSARMKMPSSSRCPSAPRRSCLGRRARRMA